MVRFAPNGAQIDMANRAHDKQAMGTSGTCFPISDSPRAVILCCLGCALNREVKHELG